MGADAVSIHINIGAEDEPEMLQGAHKCIESAREWGMSLLAMMYSRGKKIADEHNPQVVNIAVRVGAELGADIVKTNYTGDIDSFQEIVRSCPVPVIIAGGPKMSTEIDVFYMIYESIQAGGSGVAIKRNVFQADDPTKMVNAISLLVHHNYSVEEVIRELKFEI